MRPSTAGTTPSGCSTSTSTRWATSSCGLPSASASCWAETIASVIKDEPNLDRLPPGTLPDLRRLLARCLERDPKNRLRDIGEARILLSRPLVPEPSAA